jgi:hypothetical protein
MKTIRNGSFKTEETIMEKTNKKKSTKTRKRKMQLSIIDHNRGQVPYTIKEALAVAELSYYVIRKELSASSDYWVQFRTQWSGPGNRHGGKNEKIKLFETFGRKISEYFYSY